MLGIERRRHHEPLIFSEQRARTGAIVRAVLHVGRAVVTPAIRMILAPSVPSRTGDASMPATTETAKIDASRTKHGAVPGYNYGAPVAAHSPVTLTDLQRLEQTAGWTAQDAEALK